MQFNKLLNVKTSQFEHTCQIVNIKNDIVTSIPLTFYTILNLFLIPIFFFNKKKRTVALLHIYYRAPFFVMFVYF
jgi:hypothetical protein